MKERRNGTKKAKQSVIYFHLIKHKLEYILSHTSIL